VEVLANGCITKDTILVTKYNTPTVDFGVDLTICTQRSITLDPKISTNGATFLWQDNSTNSILMVNKTGEYWVEVTLGTCVVRDTIRVTYSEVSAISLGEDRVECEGDELDFDITFPGATYLWNDNSTQPNYTIRNTGLYWVRVSKDGCVKRDTLNVVFSPTPVVDFGNDTLICSTDSLILDATFPNSSYIWQNGSRSPKFLALKTGTYSVKASVGRCFASDTINVTYIKAPKLNFGEDQTLCFGKDLILNLTPNYVDYLWQDGSERSRFIIEDPGTYSVYASNICGDASDTITIDYRNCECDIFMPNAFSPNGDGVNETFGTNYECTYLDYNFQVFNRWGQLLFETKDQNQKWDGSFGGKLSPPGNYIFLLRYSLKGDGLYEELNGSFILIR
jgi:gliding motility-associated-like protein